VCIDEKVDDVIASDHNKIIPTLLFLFESALPSPVTVFEFAMKRSVIMSNNVARGKVDRIVENGLSAVMRIDTRTHE
jgi:hypothetical protein